MENKHSETAASQNNRLIKLVKRTMLLFFGLILTFVIVIFMVLWYVSPGVIEPFPDTNGKPLSESIAEKVFITIGGVKQGMIIRGKDIAKPVLLYVHGGPAFPNYFLIDKFKPGLEDNFVVCYWEQRGGGLSYSSEVTVESMNFEQLALDAIEVTNYLRKRFKQEKIYMLAHSGGTPFAIMAAAKAPQLYHAYMGMAQITNQSESEKLAYAYMLNQYKASGNTNAVNEFKKYPVLDSVQYVIPFYKSHIRDESMHELGIGTMRNMKSVFKDVFVAVWLCRAYTIQEKIGSSPKRVGGF